MRLLISVLLLAPLCSWAADTSSREILAGANQKTYAEGDFYCHHIIAVDEDGSAVLPVVTKSTAKDGTFHYTATSMRLDDEDMRGATVDSAALAHAAASGTINQPVPYNPQMAVALRGRKPLYDYLEAMFGEIASKHPHEVVVYVHGGLNKINGAIAKSALLADTFERERKGKYFVGICWNSDLIPTYGQHLFSIREGLRQPGKAILTSPAMLLSDAGGAAVRLPLNLINFWYQDAYTVHPELYKRTQLANVRYNQINEAPYSTQLGRLTATDPGDRSDQTTRFARELDLGSWLLTEPVKITSTVFLDALAAQPWKNMLRRTRTMFERESEFLPQLTYGDVKNLAVYQSNVLRRPVDPVELLDQINSTGRTGAVQKFCEYAQQRLQGAGTSQPTITLVGHSMGAIVGCEIVSRFHQLPLDNLVFEAAACSIRDFKKEVVPYMEEQNLREKIWLDFKAEYGLGGGKATPVRKTRFFNLCLHDNAENGEKNPGDLDLSQRGSLLTWIDTLYQSPESENDRTLGRWVNAILSTDDLPRDILNRITIKEFGRNRNTEDLANPPEYGYERKNGAKILEPMKHGEFSRFAEGAKSAATNLEFWADRYREPEKGSAKRDALNPGMKGSRFIKSAERQPVPVETEHKTLGAN